MKMLANTMKMLATIKKYFKILWKIPAIRIKILANTYKILANIMKILISTCRPCRIRLYCLLPILFILYQIPFWKTLSYCFFPISGDFHILEDQLCRIFASHKPKTYTPCTPHITLVHPNHGIWSIFGYLVHQNHMIYNVADAGVQRPWPTPPLRCTHPGPPPKKKTASIIVIITIVMLRMLVL